MYLPSTVEQFAFKHFFNINEQYLLAQLIGTHDAKGWIIDILVIAILLHLFIFLPQLVTLPNSTFGFGLVWSKVVLK